MFSFLDLLKSEYANGSMDFLDYASTDECKEFRNKFIQPIIDKNKKIGCEVESGFYSAIATSENQAFKDGVKMGIKMVADFLNVSVVRGEHNE